MRPLVIVRPEPGTSATAQAAEAMGIQVVRMPLFAIEPVEWAAPDPDEFDGLLLTSANALICDGSELERLRGLPAHCVGEATAAAARDAGLQVETAGNDGVDRLLSALPPDLRLLHLCGEHRREASAAAQAIVSLPVYRSRELPAPNGIARIEGGVVAVHSPRAASMLARLTNELEIRRDRIALAAISEAAARAAGTGWERVEIADAPADSRLLAIAARLCNNRR